MNYLSESLAKRLGINPCSRPGHNFHLLLKWLELLLSGNLAAPKHRPAFNGLENRKLHGRLISRLVDVNQWGLREGTKAVATPYLRAKSEPSRRNLAVQNCSRAKAHTSRRWKANCCRGCTYYRPKLTEGFWGCQIRNAPSTTGSRR